MKLALASELIEGTRHLVRARGAAPAPQVDPPRRRPAPGPSAYRYHGLHPLARRSLRGLRPLGGDALDLGDLKDALLHAFWEDAGAKAGAPSPRELDVGWIHLTAGATAAIELILRTFADPRLDRLAVATPCPRHYHHFGQLSELYVVDVPLRGADLNLLDVDGLVASEAKIILLSDPIDPVGSRVAPEQLFDLLSRTEALVVVDERHVELAEDPSAILRLAEHPNLLLVRSLSYAWGLPGARCGAILAHPLIVHTLRHAEVPSPLSDGAVAEVSFLISEGASMASTWSRQRLERDRLALALRSLPFVRWVYPSEAGYVLAQLQDPTTALRLLRERRIDVEDVGDRVAGGLRIPLGGPPDNDALLEALALAGETSRALGRDPARAPAR